MSSDAASISRNAFRAGADSAPSAYLSTSAVGSNQQRLALGVVLALVAFFLAAAPFAKAPLPAIPAFLPAYQASVVIVDVITAVLLFGQFAIRRSPALLVLASAYLFSAAMAVLHALSFPGLFATGGLFGAGPQTTAWLYFLWHGGFPLLVVAYALLKDPQPAASAAPKGAPWLFIASCVVAVLAAAGALMLLTTAGHDALPAIMQGDRDASTKVTVATVCWALSLAALPVLWRQRPHSLVDLWLMVTVCVWIFDIALAAVLNGGRYDLGWYAGRICGMLATSFVLIVLLLENGALYAQVVAARESERRQAREALAQHAERLRIVHEIDSAIIAEVKPEAIAAAVLQPLRELLNVRRAIVNMIDYASDEVEWMAAAGLHRTHTGPGVRFPMHLLGDVDALKRGEPQMIDSRALPPGTERDALLASGVNYYMAVPMIVGGELIGALSFGGEQNLFPEKQIHIAQEVATQLAIAITQARLLERIRRHAEELETANRQLRESERRFSDLLKNVQLVAVMLDREARITYCNEYLLRLTGWRYEEVIGQSWVELFIPPESGGLKDRLAVLFADQPEGRHGDNEILTRSGERRLIRWNNSVLRSGAGDVSGLASIGEDITERKRAEREIRDLNASLERRVAERTAQLKAANKELEAFSYSVSHDLRAPLRAVDGFSLMLEEDHAARLDDEGRRLLSVVRQEAGRMGHLIDDLLAFSHIGRKPIARTPFDMTALVQEVVGELSVRYPGAKIDVGRLPAGSGDRALLKQVWANLIGNALKYSARSESPRVEISGSVEGVESIYQVRDNGAGFDMRYYEKLFKVFQRLHREDEFEGTGVGLAIVQRVVVRHGGRAWGEGVVGEGASFHFSLPKEN